MECRLEKREKTFLLGRSGTGVSSGAAGPRLMELARCPPPGRPLSRSPSTPEGQLRASPPISLLSPPATANLFLPHLWPRFLPLAKLAGVFLRPKSPGSCPGWGGDGGPRGSQGGHGEQERPAGPGGELRLERPGRPMRPPRRLGFLQGKWWGRVPVREGAAGCSCSGPLPPSDTSWTSEDGGRQGSC